MPWPLILVILTLTLISAWLVFVRAWESWQAFLVVGFGAASIMVVLIATLMVFIDRKNRADVWRIICKTFWDDLDQIVRCFKIGK